jgi:hypothetical protein
VARPSKLTGELERLVVERVRAGDTVRQAAAAVGVSRRSVFRWLHASPAFAAAVEAARVRAAEDPLVLADLALKDWEALLYGR